MKTNLLPALKLTLVMLVICCVIYPIGISIIARFSKGEGKGVTVMHKGRVVGYENIGQNFSQDQYFWSRPSAVNYNAAGSGGSNKGPANPEYLATVQARIDTFLAHNPGVEKSDIPVDMITASGSGLDPNISVQAAKVQAKRIAGTRNIPEEKINQLIAEHTEKPLLGFLGPEKINVLKLNIALDDLK